MVFGKLKVISNIIKRKSHPTFLTVCECGNVSEKYANHLRTGFSQSCGCLRMTVSGKSRNGVIKTRAYNIVQNAIRRCNDVNNVGYSNYGLRGIKVHKPWVEDREKFIDYVMSLDGYSEDMELEIDRIDVNGNYEPNNLRLVNKNIQNLNKRCSGIDYIKKYNKYRVRMHVGGKSRHIGYFDDYNEAVNVLKIKTCIHFGNNSFMLKRYNHYDI